MRKQQKSKTVGYVPAIAASFLFLSCSAGSALGHGDNGQRDSVRFNANETLRQQNQLDHRADHHAAKEVRLLNTLLNHIPARTLSFDPTDFSQRGGHGPGHFRGPQGFNNGLELNLSSGDTDVVLGTKLFQDHSSVTITVGGETKTFAAGARVTPGEYVAIKQVLSGADQSITLDSTGTAIGGTFELNQVVSPSVRELVVPYNVTGIDYFSTNRSLGIRGDLSNFGSIIGVSTDQHVHGGMIFARDINNGYGGTISTILPESLAASIKDAVSDVSLTLAAYRNIENHGTISSGGTLTLATATGSITNDGPERFWGGPILDPPGFAHPDYIIYDPNNPDGRRPIFNGPTPTMSAVGDINIVAGNGVVTNNGKITSTNGNINISSTLPDTNISVSGWEGNFQALNGSINVRDPQYAGSSNIQMSGGDYLSKNLNLYSGTGTISGFIGDVSGNLTTVGDASGLQTNVHMLRFYPMTDTIGPIKVPPPGYPYSNSNLTPVVN